MDRLKVVVIGAGRRSASAWLPTIDILKDQLELLAICNTGAPRGEEQANKYGVKWYKDVNQMLDKEKPDFAVVVVNPAQTHVVGKALLERGISYITETPIAANIADADELIRLSKANNAYIEVAENLYRMPSERIKRELILNGVFGKILRAHNNSLTHNYHAVSLMRSYIGFDVRITKVIGVEANYKVQPHDFRGSEIDTEYTRHEIYFFENGSLGFSHFTGLTWGSALRGVSSTEFYGERGSAVGDKIFVLEGSKSKRQINISRLTCNIDGMEVLDKFLADTDPPIIWDNPFKNYKLSDSLITIASELASIMRAVKENVEPEYGPVNGKIDRLVDLSVAESHRNGNIPVEVKY